MAFCLFGFGGSALAQQQDPKPALPAFGKAEAMPEMDKLFRQADGWVGADGAHSFSVTPQRTI
jgi:hypothetical protein